jgi:hypothetical protein
MTTLNNKIKETEEQRFEKRQKEIAKAEKALRILKKIKWEIILLQCLANDEIMSNEVFRLVLKTSEDMKQRFDILSGRQFKIERVIFKNA